MAQDLTVTAQKNPFLDGAVGGSFSITLDWQSDASGNVSIAICSTYSTAQRISNPASPAPTKILGVIRSIEAIPGLNGDLATTLPTDQYGITLLDQYGYDVTDGMTVHCSGTVSTKQYPARKIIIDSELTLTIVNAGSTKTGRILVEFEDTAGHKF